MYVTVTGVESVKFTTRCTSILSYCTYSSLHNTSVSGHNSEAIGLDAGASISYYFKIC
jgi:hypothetical protein